MGPGQQRCDAEGPLVLGRADRGGIALVGEMHKSSGMSTTGQATLGHSVAPNDNTEATVLQHK